MILRTWSARATPAGADSYHRYFENTLLPQLRTLPGFELAFLLARDMAGEVELTTHTVWASLEAIAAFAGPDIGHSVVEPEARAVLSTFDTDVVHRTVLLAAMPDQRGVTSSG